MRFGLAMLLATAIAVFFLDQPRRDIMGYDVPRVERARPVSGFGCMVGQVCATTTTSVSSSRGPMTATQLMSDIDRRIAQGVKP